MQAEYFSWTYLERLPYLIIELLAPYTGPTFARACWVSTLYHKALNISVEYGPIIVATGT